MRIRSRHMGLAIGAALAIHVAAAIAMVLEPEERGAASTGVGGIQVSLGPAGGAPGSTADVVSDIEQAEPVDPAAAPTAEPDPVQAEKAEVEEILPETPPATAADRPVAAPVETAVEAAEIVEKVDEVIAIARPEAVEIPPVERPEPAEIEVAEVEPVKAEPVQVESVEPPEPVKVEPQPEPVTVARAEPMADPVETPPLPVTRPRPPVPQKTEVEREPAPVPEQTAAVAVEAPPAETAQPAPPQTSGAAGRSGVGQSQQSGSAEASSGGGRPGVSVDYVSILQAWLEEHKEYPRRARSRRQEGVVWLYFVMDRQGHVLEHRIDRSSGYTLLDREVEEMIRRAQPLPALPADMAQARLELVVPVQFQLR